MTHEGCSAEKKMVIKEIEAEPPLLSLWKALTGKGFPLIY
jgi:hypothetical protein